MKAGDTAYWGDVYWGEADPIRIVQVTVTDVIELDDPLAECDLERVIAGPRARIYSRLRLYSDELHPTLTAALAWLIERATARLAEQEREAAQTRETLGELRGMLEEAEG